MSVIYKYPIKISSMQWVSMPQGAKILDVQVQNGQPQLWALVDPTQPTVEREISIYGTGHPVAERPGTIMKHIATFQVDKFVWHVFEYIKS